jgi:hypothetical protein
MTSNICGNDNAAVFDGSCKYNGLSHVLRRGLQIARPRRGLANRALAIVYFPFGHNRLVCHTNRRKLLFLRRLQVHKRPKRGMGFAFLEKIK